MPKPNFELIERIRFQEPSKKLIYVLMGLLLVYVIVRGLFAAAGKTLWYDELLTLTVSSQGNWTAIVSALQRPVDGQPPLFYVIEHFAAGLTRNREIALRLASILAFPCTLISVFVYVKKRSGEAIAFICALLLLLTSLFHRFAVEARPYSMMIACVAFALVCYQRASSRFWTAMLGLTLALAETLHYYSVFCIIPFGLAETVYFLRTHKFRWGVWLAMVFGAMPLALFWPLLASTRAHFMVHLFSTYSLSSFPGTYGAFFGTDSAFATAILAVSIGGIVGTLLLPPPETSPLPGSRDENVSEGILLLSFVLLPLIIFPIIRVMHGGLRDAYVLAAILGIALALAGSLSLARPGVVALFAVFIVFAVAVREFKFWRSNHSLHMESPTAGIQKFIEKSGYPDLPVAVSSGMKYTPLAYYAPPTFSKRLFYLLDEEKEFKYEGTDSFSKNVVILRDYMPLQVVDFSEFTAAQPVFLVYTEEPEDAGTWLPQHLSHEAASMRTIAVEPARRLYLVTMKGNSTH